MPGADEPPEAFDDPVEPADDRVAPTTGAPDPAVEVTDLRRRYGDVTALDGLSLSVERGELYGLLGPNGAGKSTTINVLTGQLRPDSGRARVLGVDPVAEPVRARRAVGVLPERGRPPSFMTPREYLGFVGGTYDLASVDDRVATWADRLGFGGQLDTLAADLSQGERQKLLIAAAFLHEPELVFIDEPLTNLDPIVQERVKRFFEEYVAAGNTLFLSTHFVETAEALCTRVGILRDGRLAAEVVPGEDGTAGSAGAGSGDEPADDGGAAGGSLLDRFVDEVGADAPADRRDRRNADGRMEHVDHPDADATPEDDRP